MKLSMQRCLRWSLYLSLALAAGCESRSLPANGTDDGGTDGTSARISAPDGTPLADETMEDELETGCPAEPAAAAGTPCDAAVAGEMCPLCDPSVECCRQYLVCMGNTWQIMEAGPCGIPCDQEMCDPAN